MVQGGLLCGLDKSMIGIWVLDYLLNRSLVYIHPSLIRLLYQTNSFDALIACSFARSFVRSFACYFTRLFTRSQQGSVLSNSNHGAFIFVTSDASTVDNASSLLVDENFVSVSTSGLTAEGVYCCWFLSRRRGSCAVCVCIPSPTVSEEFHLILATWRGCQCAIESDSFHGDLWHCTPEQCHSGELVRLKRIGMMERDLGSFGHLRGFGRREKKWISLVSIKISAARRRDLGNSFLVINSPSSTHWHFG